MKSRGNIGEIFGISRENLGEILGKLLYTKYIEVLLGTERYFWYFGVLLGPWVLIDTIGYF